MLKQGRGIELEWASNVSCAPRAAISGRFPMGGEKIAELRHPNVKFRPNAKRGLSASFLSIARCDGIYVNSL